ncbi:MAG: phospholipase D-like domain-containing protein [Acidobacteriota bacterium]
MPRLRTAPIPKRRTHPRRLLRILAAALVALAAPGCTILYNAFASEKRSVYHFDHPFATADPAFQRSLDAFGTQMTGGNAVELLNNGDQFFPAMLGAIAAASRSVDLESYIFHDDRAGRLFAGALVAAAKRGVEVRVLVDGAGGRAGKLFDVMRAGGVKIRVYHPLQLLTIYRLGRRTHRKILVVDGTECFTGGMGIDERWLGNARNPREWRDVEVEARGPITAEMQAIFAEDWTYTTGEILAGDKFYPPLRPVGSVLAQAIKVSSGDSSSLSKMLYYVAIKSATKSIHIENAYFLPDRQVRDALIQAVHRGVDVEVIVPGKHIDIPIVRMASRLHYGSLLAGGVRIFEFRDTNLHSKTLVVDGIFSTVGSINLDQRSMTKAAEESLSFYDRGFAAEMDRVFAADRARSQEVTYRAWKRRGLLKRLGELVSWMWEPLY